MSGALKTNDGRLIIVSGASRCGKTTQTANEVRNERRICAWDPEAQWSELPGWRKVTTRAELMQAIQARGYMRIAFVPGPDLKADFDYWAAAVFHAGRFGGPLVAIAEDLADVTTPSKAPGHWGILLRRGLKRGITIYAISQRWAEADKTAIGNCSEFVLFAARGDDIKYIARKARVPEERLEALAPLEFLRVDPLTKQITEGKVRFR
jgi:hypothetical protein